jgi:hypothetical protein
MGFPPKQDPLQQSVQELGRGSTPLRMQHPRPGRHSQRPVLHDKPTAALQPMHASPPVPQTSYSPMTHVPNAQQPVAQVDFLQRLGFFGVFLAMTHSALDRPVNNPTPRRLASTRRRLAAKVTAFAIASNCSASIDSPLFSTRPGYGSSSDYRYGGPRDPKRYTIVSPYRRSCESGALGCDPWASRGKACARIAI